MCYNENVQCFLLTCSFAVMKQTLTNLFRNYGEVLDVVAHRNIRMRGQAFVSFPDPEIAKKAQKEVNRFPLYSKALASILHPS